MDKLDYKASRTFEIRLGWDTKTEEEVTVEMDEFCFIVAVRTVVIRLR